MKAVTLSLLAAAALLAACATPGPQPEPMAAIELPAGTDVAPLAPQWWRQFGDAQLDALVDEALANNRDLARAMARIDASRAALRLAGADRLPSVGAQLLSTRQRISENGSAALPAGASPVGNLHRAALDVSYELDLWGRAASATRAAREALLASTYAQATLRTALAAQVVQSYAALQALDAQRALFGQAVDAQSESLQLQRLRLEAGDIGELDVHQLEAELIFNQALLPQLDRARGQAERALAQVLGRSPRAMLAEPPARAERPAAVAGALPAALPSDLLLRRPDVQAAEAQLRAAGARVDAARAAYFPRIGLSAAIGGESTELSKLFDGPSLIWSVLASLTQPIFDGGRIDAQNELARAERLQAELDYRDSVANAFREARDALAAHEEAQSTLRSNEQRAAALARADEITRLRAQGGEASRLDAIEAERAALTARAAIADARRALAAAQADVYRALGGGWQLPAEDQAGAAAPVRR